MSGGDVKAPHGEKSEYLEEAKLRRGSGDVIG